MPCARAISLKASIICYHGVMDAFRNPKLAAAAYASQGETSPVLALGSSMDIGDYPAGRRGRVYVFSNEDEAALYKNGAFVTRLRQDQTSPLPHPPFVMDDTIGKLLAAGKYGLADLPASYKVKMAWCMLRYGMKFQDGVDLYGKYVANWGGEATSWRFDGIKDGKTVASVTCRPSAKLHLEVTASHTSLTEGTSYDMAAIRVRQDVLVLSAAFGNGCPPNRPSATRSSAASSTAGPGSATRTSFSFGKKT